MHKTVTVLDVDFEVEYTASEYIPATFFDPAEGGEVEVLAVMLDGHEVSEMLAEWVLDRIQNDCEEGAQEALREARDAAKCDRYESEMEDRCLQEQFA